MQTEQPTELSHHDDLFYQQMRALARKLMSAERSNHTLSATDLVHEAFIRLSVADLDYVDQQHRYRTFARQMRRLLVNHAVHKQTQKNRGQAIHLTESLNLVDGGWVDFSVIDQAIEELEAMDARSAQAIELAYFTSLKQTEIARMLEVSLATLERDLKFGRAMIQDHIKNHEPS